MPLTARLRKEPIDVLFVELGMHKKDPLSPTLGLGFNFLPNGFTFKRVFKGPLLRSNSEIANERKVVEMDAFRNLPSREAMTME